MVFKVFRDSYLENLSPVSHWHNRDSVASLIKVLNLDLFAGCNGFKKLQTHTACFEEKCIHFRVFITI